MREHQQQTEFLKRCLLYGPTVENQKLAERITEIQKNERRVQHALKVAGGFAIVAAAGLGYSAIFLTYYPENALGFATHLVAQIFCVMGLVSILCLLIFIYLGSVHRGELDKHREECRETVTKIMESRLGNRVALAPKDNRETTSRGETSLNLETQNQASTQQRQLS
jgi:uncharacterized membrane protein